VYAEKLDGAGYQAPIPVPADEHKGSLCAPSSKLPIRVDEHQHPAVPKGENGGGVIRQSGSIGKPDVVPTNGKPEKLDDYGRKGAEHYRLNP
jgi:hypothetical protein